ncbi:MAG: gamma-glutamylcyclotransferase [Candidatus Lokiarchaeota archaeon]|nr:gamma-glutamylcyclotransferase [Candidatus Lokiarchaeota archaeon]
MSSDKKNRSYASVIGYGTFITRGYWKDKQNVESCLVNNYSRVFPRKYWFPVVLPSDDSFWALKFDVSQEELNQLDNYEGVHLGLFERIQTKVELKTGSKINAFLYVPTENLIVSQMLTNELDTSDRWKEHIRTFPEIVQLFPELIL